MIWEIQFTREGFKSVLDTFSEAAQTQNYNRVEYESWRTLQKNEKENIIVQFTNNIMNIINGAYFLYSDNIKNNSLAAFIYNNYHPLKNNCFNTTSASASTSDGISTALNTHILNDYNYNKTATGTVINKTRVEENKEGDIKMKGINFNFGSCENDNIKMSMYGLAIKNMNNEWVSYDKTTGNIINVDLFNFDFSKYMYKMPVAFKDIEIGDVLIHNKTAVFVTELGENENGVVAVDVREGEEKKIVLTSNMFNFNFATKVVSLFNLTDMAPTPEQPFGNMLPLFIMEEGKDVDPMMFMLMMNQNKGSMNMNPMMMYFMMKDNKNSDLLPLMFMMNGNAAAV